MKVVIKVVMKLVENVMMSVMLSVVIIEGEMIELSCLANTIIDKIYNTEHLLPDINLKNENSNRRMHSRRT